MSKFRKLSCIFHLCVLGSALAVAQAPSIFFSDLTSGPNTGGEGNGSIVTLYGKRFGATQGGSTVTVGSGTVATYKLWTDTKIAVAIGSAATTGNIVVHTSAGDSNPMPFTVRSGNIFFVSTSGNDGNTGSFGAPWRTIVRAKNSIAAGDIAYIMNGVSQTTVDDHGAALDVASAGAPGRPKALLAYPGAVVTIGDVNGPEFAIRTPAISGGPFSFWTIAGFILRGNNQAIDLVNMSNWRIVANDMSCPKGNGPAGCFATETSNNLAVLGNNVHDSGAVGSQKVYHSIYFSTDSNHIEVAWNVVANNNSCRGIQFHSTGGNNQFDLIVHDNLIHGQVCDGINFATIDPSKGPVQAYNNVIYHVGVGPDPPDGESNYTCIYSPGLTNAGQVGSGTAEVFNNTLYDCGSQNADPSAAGAISVQAGSPNFRLRNNIVVAKSGTGETYFPTGPHGQDFSLLSGSNNLFFGAGSAPAPFTASVNADPLFVSVSTPDFHLRATSPAIGKGVNTGLLSTPADFDGVFRGPGFDIGAFQIPLPSVTLSTSVNPAQIGQPVTLTATVSSSAGTPTGTVTFKDGVTTLGTGPLTAGVATFTGPFSAVGAHSITAAYSGDSIFQPNTSSALTQNVILAITSTGIVPSQNPTTISTSTTLTANVTSTYGGTPTGTVSFQEGGAPLGSPIPLSSGSASISHTFSTVGLHTITVTYSGDSNHNVSSGLLQQIVYSSGTTATTTGLSYTQNPAPPPSHLNLQQALSRRPINLSANVSPPPSDNSDQVLFLNGSTVLGTASVISGVAALPIRLGPGSRQITAYYLGDTTNAGSTVNLVINQSPRPR